MKTHFGSSDELSREFHESSFGATTTLDDAEALEGSEASTCDGPQCEKCGAAMTSDVVTVCRHCGWYASLGTFLEIDRDWEFQGDEEEAAVAPKPQPSHLEVWLHLLPHWAWVMFGTGMLVIAESIAVRLLTTTGSSIRTTWAVTQLVGGQLIFFACHLTNLLIAASEDPDIGILDSLLKPLKLWIRAAKELPKHLWMANAAINGLLTAELAVLVIGGIPYERMWDWGFKQPPKENLMAAVMEQAAKAKSESKKDLEGAVGDFANQAGAGMLPSDGKPDAEKPAEKPREKTDCVILGYHADKDGNLLSLLLGTVHHGKLVFAGSISPKLEGKELADFTKALAAAKTDRPFLDSDSDATWVTPRFSCKVSYLEQDEMGRLHNAEWVELLGTTGL